MRLQTASRKLLCLSLVWSDPLLWQPCLGREHGAAAVAGKVNGISAASGASAAIATETCEARTINYITHTLPQQCLRTSWPGSSIANASVTGAGTIVTSAGETAAAAGDGTQTPTRTDSQAEASSAPPGDGTGGDAKRGQEGSGAAGDEKSQEQDPDSDLATSSFMSFEEWKEVQLKKAGQDPAELRARKQQQQQHERGERGDYSHQDLDSVGDDGEINLDFNALTEKVSEITASGGQGGQGAGGSGAWAVDGAGGREDGPGREDALLYADGTTQYIRSKDAGKTCKERFSYASFDAGATVIKTSPRAKNAKAILVENKDSYMLLECSQPKKFVVVELSDDILVDTVVLANFEFFSSMVRTFRVSVSDRYPVKAEKSWKDLGIFEARNQRDIQAFLVEHPQIWAKYIRIEFLTHYGSEFYCPISLLRVHGTRMIDSWKESENGGRDDDDEPAIEAEPSAPPPASIEAGGGEGATAVPDGEIGKGKQPSEDSPLPPEEYTQPSETTAAPVVTEVGLSPWRPIFREFSSMEMCEMPTASTVVVDPSASSHPGSEHGRETQPPAGADPPEGGNSRADSSVSSGASAPSSHTKAPANATLSDSAASQFAGPSAASASSSAPQSASSHGSASGSSPSEANQTASQPPRPDSSSGSVSSPSASSVSQSKPSASVSKPPSQPPKPSSQKPSNTVPSSGAGAGASGSGTKHGHHHHHSGHGNNNHGHNNKTGTSSGSAAPASPTVQESFFKTVAKRLQLLESNTSLSMQYIEDQSRFLQEALTKMERKQISRVDSFLDTLNRTVLAELSSVRQQYDQIWQSTVIALESQRDQSQREIVALSARLNVLADEVVFQKRMAILQSLLLLACLVLIVFSRSFTSGAGFGSGSASSFRYFSALSPPPSAGPSPRRLYEPGGAPSPSSSPARGIGGVRIQPPGQRLQPQQQPQLVRTRSAPYPFADKTLPLTPTSETGDGPFDGAPPSIHVVDEDGPSGYFSPSTPGFASPPRPDARVDDTSLEPVSDDADESSPSAVTPTASSPPLDGSAQLDGRRDEQGDDDICGNTHFAEDEVRSSPDPVLEESRPPLTRTALSDLSSSRKPLPALPEDLVQLDETPT